MISPALIIAGSTAAASVAWGIALYLGKRDRARHDARYFGAPIDPFDSRPQGDYDSAEARARRVAALTAEREALERQADAGRDRREARDAQRRRWLDLERIRYRLGRRARHVDDMVA